MIRRRFRGIPLYYRPRTSDLKAIMEVVVRGVYEHRFQGADFAFDIRKGEKWLDLGANIGAFTCYAGRRGATVESFEPFPASFEVLKRNAELNQVPGHLHQAAVVGTAKKAMTLFTAGSNSWRNSLVKNRGMGEVQVPCVNINAVLTEDVTGIKMDVEGAEFELLGAIRSWKNVRKLVFEYSFDCDDDMGHFRARMKFLGRAFPFLRHPRFPKALKKHHFFPPACLVFAMR